MADLGSVMTLRELAHGTDVHTEQIVELLARKTPLIEDMAFRNGNQLDGHMFRERVGLPKVSWRAVNEGVKPTRSSAKTLRETCGMLEAVSEIDKVLVELEEGKDAQRLFRIQEAAAFLQAMAQQFARAVWYGDNGFAPKEITGLSKRYGTLHNADEPWKDNYIIDAGGTGNDLSSIWLIVHSTESFFGIVPKNGKVGLTHEASGVIDLDDVDENGLHHGTFQGYRDRFKWWVGVCVKDYRQIVRICNIDTSELFSDGTSSSTAANLLRLVNTATNRIEDLNAGRPVFYMNRLLKDFWEKQLLTSSFIEKNMDQATGKINVSYKGFPIHIDDMLLSTEERVN